MKHFDVILRNRSGRAELISKSDIDVSEFLGGRFADADQKLCEKLDIKGGIEVISIKYDGLLSREGVRRGFIITHINDSRVLSMSDLSAVKNSVKSIDGVYPDGKSASYSFER